MWWCAVLLKKWNRKGRDVVKNVLFHYFWEDHVASDEEQRRLLQLAIVPTVSTKSLIRRSNVFLLKIPDSFSVGKCLLRLKNKVVINSNKISFRFGQCPGQANGIS